MNTIEVLKAARAKIEKPENWTQHYYARKDVGATALRCESNSPFAVCWCALGAIGAVIDEDFPDNNHPAIEALSNQLPPGRWIADFNDSPVTDHADVLALFDRAIAAEEAKA